MKTIGQLAKAGSQEQPQQSKPRDISLLKDKLAEEMVLMLGRFLKNSPQAEEVPWAAEILACDLEESGYNVSDPVRAVIALRVLSRELDYWPTTNQVLKKIQERAYWQRMKQDDRPALEDRREADPAVRKAEIAKMRAVIKQSRAKDAEARAKKKAEREREKAALYEKYPQLKHMPEDMAEAERQEFMQSNDHRRDEILKKYGLDKIAQRQQEN